MTFLQSQTLEHRHRPVMIRSAILTESTNKRMYKAKHWEQPAYHVTRVRCFARSSPILFR